MYSTIKNPALSKDSKNSLLIIVQKLLKNCIP